MVVKKQKSLKSDVLRQTILQHIYTGELKQNEKIDSCRKLCKTYGLSYVTVNKVIKELCNDGILETIPGSGTIVKSTKTLKSLKPRRILLYSPVISEQSWNSLVSAESILKDVFYPRFVGQYSSLLNKENLEYNPDFISTSDELVETMVRRKHIRPLNDVVKNYGIDLKQYPEGILDPFIVDGNLYALPVCFSNFSLFYNKDLFDAVGLDYPDNTWNWNDLLEASKKLTSIGKNKINHFGFAPFIDKGNIVNFYVQGLMESEDPEKRLLTNFDTTGLDYLLSLVHKEEVAPTMQDSETFVIDLFTTGKTAMTCCKYKMVQLLKKANFRWGVTTLPKGNSHCSCSALQGIAISKNVSPTASHVEQLKALTGENMQKLLLNNFGHLPVYNDLLEAAPFSKSFIEQIPYDRNIYLNFAENSNLIKSLVFQMFIKFLSPQELLSELRDIMKREKDISMRKRTCKEMEHNL